MTMLPECIINASVAVYRILPLLQYFTVLLNILLYLFLLLCDIVSEYKNTARMKLNELEVAAFTINRYEVSFLYAYVVLRRKWHNSSI